MPALQQLSSTGVSTIYALNRHDVIIINLIEFYNCTRLYVSGCSREMCTQVDGEEEDQRAAHGTHMGQLIDTVRYAGSRQHSSLEKASPRVMQWGRRPT